MGGLLAATLPTNDPQYETVVTNAYQMYLGYVLITWRIYVEPPSLNPL